MSLNNFYFFLVGPIFTQHTNSTYWIERGISTTFNLTCTVISSFPAVNNLSFTDKSCDNDANCKIETDGHTYISLILQNATEKDGRNYTCLGKTGYTTGNTLFQTFIGGKD